MPYGRDVRKVLARIILTVGRYRIVGSPPTSPACVLVAAPHTSNWDFLLMLAMSWSSGLDPVWLGKKELFRWPFGVLSRAVGGIEVDRKNPGALVEQLATRARVGTVSAIVVPAEGTRSRGEYWKSGFRRIAIDAGIPIVLTYLDGPTRTGGFGPEFTPSDDVVADMDIVREFYKDKHGVKPKNATPPLLREEAE